MCGYAVYHTITILSIITHWFGFWKTNFNELLLWRWWNEAFLLHLLREGWGVLVGKSNSKFGLALHMDWEHFCWLEVVSLFPLVVVTFNCNWNCYFYCYYLNLFYFYFISFVWLLASEWWLPLECLRCFLLIVVLWLLHLVLLLRCNCRCFLLLMLLLLFSDPWFTCGLFEKHRRRKYKIVETANIQNPFIHLPFSICNDKATTTTTTKQQPKIAHIENVSIESVFFSIYVGIYLLAETNFDSYIC